MKQTGSTLVLLITWITFLVNIVGVAIPYWYSKEHGHNVNATDVKYPCEVRVKIREGLWQRYCYEVRGAECVPDIQEWCQGLDAPEFKEYVIGVELVADLFLIFVIVTVIRSKCCNSKGFFNMEMVGVEIGLAGLLMLIGVLVYVAADSGEIEYDVTDLHVSWIMCCSSAGLSLLLSFVCLCIDTCEGGRSRSGYMPLYDTIHYDNTVTISDDEPMIDM